MQKILRVLVEDYIKPFGLDVENEYLVSMRTVSDEITNSILSVQKEGRILYKEFPEKCIKLGTVPFHDPIKKNSVKFFNDDFSGQGSSKRISSVEC